MTRCFTEFDFAKEGKITFVSSFDGNEIRCFCSSCKKWQYHRLVRSFVDKKGVWNAIYECKVCGK